MELFTGVHSECPKSTQNFLLELFLCHIFIACLLVSGLLVHPGQGPGLSYLLNATSIRYSGNY